MRVTRILVDDRVCAHTSLVVLNCDQIVGSWINPRDNATFDLQYHETFLTTRTTKVLTVETDQFTQKFLIDFVIPEMA